MPEACSNLTPSDHSQSTFTHADTMETAKTKQKKQKKPFHIKRGDLDLAGYKKDLQDRSPAHLFNRAVTSLRTSRQFHLYLLIQALAAAIGYGQLALCIGSSREFPH